MVSKTSAEITKSNPSESTLCALPLFNPSLYPKTYQPLFFNKLLSFIMIFICANVIWLFFTKVSINYESILITLLALSFLYLRVIRYVFGYKVTLYADRIQVDYLFSKKTMLRADIKTMEYWSLSIACVKLNQRKHGGFLVHTLHEFEEDSDFIDWFNTLDAEIIQPITK